ncbi:hypothetical protein BV25DRAFT_1824863 [Artomyces pyxidatus]|uniref:Uncharacterized protein n=1 Tax=Artomyces pyxidatus TaxID=48021 RepID=A0ACB8T1W5_9AGAM|nr:hypothetical protein BV25DRAFT_1824863 [Artomyces pyxidatus]
MNTLLIAFDSLRDASFVILLLSLRALITPVLHHSHSSTPRRSLPYFSPFSPSTVDAYKSQFALGSARCGAPSTDRVVCPRMAASVTRDPRSR